MMSVSENRNKAYQFLERIGTIQHLIDGESVPASSGETFENHTPLDNSVINRVAKGTVEDIDRAAKAAEAAFPAWRDMPAKERRAILHKVADLIEANAEELSLLEVLDTGQPLRFMAKAALRGAANFRFFADRCEEARDGKAMPTEEHLNYTSRTPIGAVGVITPWNTPFMLSTWKIAPALAAGCTVVHKPAEFSPVTALRLHQLMLEAGIPKGVVNMVNGFGETAGKALTEHPAIKAIAFVGESNTGSHIMRQGADTLKRVHFELGGKNPVVVFKDADLERALDAVIFMIYSLNGERCTSSSRLLVEQAIYDDFTHKLAERVKNIRVADPFDPNTEIGPLIHPSHFEKVCSYFEIAKAEGATIAAGGAALEQAGNYVPATLFTHARNDMRIAQEEIFGPVLTAIPFADEAEALKLANDVQYGLTGYIWTKDIARAHSFAAKLEAGMIWINSQNVRHLPAPFGGMKASGIGRDGGPEYSFDFYMESKNIAVALGEHHIPKLGA